MSKELLTSFLPFELSDALTKALEDMKYSQPSAIQAQTIPILLKGQDVIAVANTGTGKTAAFVLPILNQLSTSVKGTQALVLAPTRELAIQVAQQFELLSAHMPGVQIAVLCGGQEYTRQLKQLRGGAQIVVGTPGRILDHIERGSLTFSHLKTFILDEADEMLRMGFIEDVEVILSKLPEKRQIGLFSATMPYRIRQIATTYLVEPASVEIKMPTATVDTVKQTFIFVGGHQKPEALVRVLAVEAYQGVIVFVRTKTSSEEVATILQQQGLKAMAIHGDITQTLRERIIVQFKQGSIDVLVATDVAARGLDVERVTHVINYDMPQDHETYVHRIGRTGRAGRSGSAILFVTPKESRLISSLERHTRQRVEKGTIPSDQLIQAARQEQFMTKISARLDHPHLPAYKGIIEDYVKQNDVALVDVAATLALLLHQDLPWNVAFPTLKTENRPSSSSKRSSSQSDRSYDDKKSFGSERRSQDKKAAFGQDRKKTIRDRDPATQDLFRIDVGKVHGVKPGNIVGAIANEANLQSKFITRLQIHEHHSTVCLPKDMSQEAVRDLTKAWVCGRQLNLTRITTEA